MTRRTAKVLPKCTALSPALVPPKWILYFYFIYEGEHLQARPPALPRCPSPHSGAPAKALRESAGSAERRTRGPAQTPGPSPGGSRQISGRGLRSIVRSGQSGRPFPCSQSRATPASHPGRPPTLPPAAGPHRRPRTPVLGRLVTLQVPPPPSPATAC